MSIDVFGRLLGGSKGKRGPPGNGYKMTAEGHYDVENKRLCNLASPEDINDAVSVYHLRLEMKQIYDNMSKYKSEMVKTVESDERVVIDRILEQINVLDTTVHASGGRIDNFISKFEDKIKNFDTQALLSLQLINQSITGLRDDYIKLRKEQDSSGATQTGSA